MTIATHSLLNGFLCLPHSVVNATSKHGEIDDKLIITHAIISLFIMLHYVAVCRVVLPSLCIAVLIFPIFFVVEGFHS